MPVEHLITASEDDGYSGFVALTHAFVKLIGAAAAGTPGRSFVAEADAPFPPVRVGWLKIAVHDVGGQIATDGYYTPFCLFPNQYLIAASADDADSP